ncbi:MAG: hypothetical protein EAX95_06535 [Candidatus Thorarchaeota archaeon]|nr:hypothetical protein [Candidatus Thorarchaeota archaeon]
MTDFEQEWISPILEAYKKEKLTESYTVLLGLNPVGQSLCRQLYERNNFETVLIFNSPSFSVWNRYPTDVKPPVIPVHGMINGDLMIIFGDILVREYEWVTDLLFYLRGNIPTRFVISVQTYDGPSCAQVVSSKGERLTKRMSLPLGRSDFYDGLTGPLMSVGPVAGLDPVVLFLEASVGGEVIMQQDDLSVCQEEIEEAYRLLDMGLALNMLGPSTLP